VNSARLVVQPLDLTFSLKDKVYQALKGGILSMNIYASPAEIRLDERQLADDLGVSRTPIREAISRLEQEGFVRIVQRKGVFVVRKTKREVVDLITAWAALEGMAARLVTQRAGRTSMKCAGSWVRTLGDALLSSRETFVISRRVKKCVRAWTTFCTKRRSEVFRARSPIRSWPMARMRRDF
jgi:DNA-binding transcriptional regulator YhcF (GntR family)